MVDAPMPVFRIMPYPLPDVNGTDNAGKPYQEGSIYTWPDGSAAMFRNHQLMTEKSSTETIEGPERFGVMAGGIWWPLSAR